MCTHHNQPHVHRLAHTYATITCMSTQTFYKTIILSWHLMTWFKNIYNSRQKSIINPMCSSLRFNSGQLVANFVSSLLPVLSLLYRLKKQTTNFEIILNLRKIAIIENTQILFTQIHWFLTFCHICFIILTLVFSACVYVCVHIYIKILIFWTIWKEAAWLRPLYFIIPQCPFPKNEDIFLHSHSTVIKFRS